MDKHEIREKKILVYGSLNIDFVFSVSHFVKKGETLLASEVQQYPGGKGLNQAIAAARAKAEVWMAGNIGENGRFLKELLDEAGVHTEEIRQVDTLTGTAFIQKEDSGDNCIIVSPLANHRVDERQMERVFEHFGSNDLLLCQNEINAMESILEKGAEKGMMIVFNPAPMTDEVRNYDLSKISLLVVNESELQALFNPDQENLSLEELMDRCKEIYPKMRLIATAGHHGAWYQDEHERFFVPAYFVQAVDTTGAGDTFTGVVCALLSRGRSVKEAMKMAAAASALCVTKNGAASSIPDLDQILKFLERV